MPRYFLEVMYDGTAFHGSQVQGALPTVQRALNKALSTLLRVKIETYGASRTDEGVHALCNYYHFDLDAELADRILYQLNALLPTALSVRYIYRAANNELNARFDAIKRSYRYRIYDQKNPFLNNRALYYPYRIDKEILKETCAIIKATTDFESFSKRKGQTKTFICTIEDNYWIDGDNELQYVVVANRFLRGMVRALVSTQLQVARGRYTVDDFKEIIEARDCTRADFSVAGHGLYLEKITYPEGALVRLQAEE